jgi:hypothetical protein
MVRHHQAEELQEAHTGTRLVRIRLRHDLSYRFLGDEMEQTRIPKNRSLMIHNAMKKVGMTTNILRLQHHES